MSGTDVRRGGSSGRRTVRRGRGEPGLRVDLLACAALVLVCLAFFWPVFAGRVLVPGDGAYFIDQAFAPYRPADVRAPINTTLVSDQLYQFYVWRQFVGESLRAGHVPLWNPYAGCGLPLHANNQTALLHPVNFALNLLLPAGRAQTVFSLLGFLVACLSTYGLVRALGGTAAGGVLAGLAYGFGGFIFIWLGYPLVQVAAWLPALLWATHRVILKPSLRGAVLIAAIMGWQLLAGHLGTSAQLLAFWLVFVLYDVFALRRPRIAGKRRAPAALGVLALGLLLGLGIGAAQLLPTGEYYGLSATAHTGGRNRWGSDRPLQALKRSLLGDWWFLRGPARGELALLFVPERHGNPAFDDYHPYPGYGNYAERASYVGTVALLVLLAGLLWRPPPGYPRFFLGASWLVFGALLHLPILNAVTYLPVLKLVEPSRLRFVFMLCAAVTLGLVTSEWFSGRRREGRRPRLWPAAVGLLLVSGALAATAVPGLAPHFGALTRPDLLLRLAKLFAPAAAAAALATLLLVSARRPLRREVMVGGVIAISIADLFLFGARWHPLARRETILPEVPTVREMRERVGGGRVAGPPQVFVANAAVRFHLYDTRAYDPIAMGRYAGLVRTLSGGAQERGGTMVPSLKGLPAPALSFYRVAGVTSYWAAGKTAAWELTDLPNPLPRAYVAGAVCRAGPEEALRLLAHGLDPTKTTLVEDPAAACAGEAGIRRAVILEEGASRVVVKASTPAPSWLVLTDTFYPGWRAEVNGRPAAIRVANYAFRAVPVPAGESVVTFRYQPGTYRVGVFAAMLAWAVMVALLGAGPVARRARPPA
jgi:hypothetical protein